MDILDLQLQWHWVWVLKMASSFNVMVLQREMWTKEFQDWITTSGRFMTASIISLQLIFVSQLCIYLPSALMIYPTRMKDPDIPGSWSQLPSMLPLKVLLLLWPNLMIHQISFLLMILILSMLWRNMWISKVGSTEDTDVENMVK